MVVPLLVKSTKIRVLFVTRRPWASGDGRRRGEIRLEITVPGRRASHKGIRARVGCGGLEGVVLEPRAFARLPLLSTQQAKFTTATTVARRMGVSKGRSG
jgi:hypothetical protein